jgi:hypothetical protein
LAISVLIVSHWSYFLMGRCPVTDCYYEHCHFGLSGLPYCVLYSEDKATGWVLGSVTHLMNHLEPHPTLFLCSSLVVTGLASSGAFGHWINWSFVSALGACHATCYPQASCVATNSLVQMVSALACARCSAFIVSL